MNHVMTETWPFEPAVRQVVELLARGEYAAVERLSGGVRLTADELAGAVRAYGRRLVVPPPVAAPLDVVPHADGGGWSVDVPLWTAEEGRSDLTLQLTVLPGPGAAHRIEVDDLHVL
jgi:hypothetical protein